MAQEATLIGGQLTRVRRRGIDDLEINAGNKTVVEIEELTKLASDYCRTNSLRLSGRRPQIARLLTDGLAEYELSGNSRDAQFIRSLFFAEGVRMNSRQATVLLKEAKEAHQNIGFLESKHYDPRSFDSYRSITFEDFARFLIGWVVTDGGAAS
ncbi:hypothetical protein [Streptacidiphilus sp. PAMC 29251]